jgi:tyrosinase
MALDKRSNRNNTTMNHFHGDHQMPQSFDEVIARGFPRGLTRAMHPERFAGAADEVGRRVRRPGIRLPTPVAGAAVATRKNQADLSDSETTAFRNAVTRLVAEGQYLQLIQDHMDMSHNMHGTMGEIGLYRFLGWHRRYLIAFERELQRVDRALRPNATELLGVPYWRWQDDFPEWLEDFLPANDPVTGNPPPARIKGPPERKPDGTDIDDILNHFDVQNTEIAGENDYIKFTWGIEGWGVRPDGSPLRAHNHGHVWIGGIMNNTSTSPTDPMFWLHHAEIDRLWHNWRQTHADPAPPLVGLDRVMDPWAESYDELLDISALAYSYDSLAP